MSEQFEEELKVQTFQRKSTVELINLISDLWYENAIEIVLFRKQLMYKNVHQVLSLFAYAREFVKKPISISVAIEIAKAIKELNMAPAKLDLGKLTYEYFLEGEPSDVKTFISVKLRFFSSAQAIEPKDVVLYGFGRIGRLLSRELMSNTGKGKQMRLRAIVVRGVVDAAVLEKRASLLMHDSIHGDFSGVVTIDIEKKALIINGTTVYVISAKQPEDIDYTSYGIKNALIIDNTGAFRDQEALGRHLKSKGAEKVLLTAPGKGVPNIVHGVNHKEYDVDMTAIYSAASCTTNAITPVLKVIEDHFGVVSGHLETIHAYTNDQNLVDNMHSKYRRGRAAALNMVITETGAGTAVSKALPSLAGKLTSNAIRVPVPNGSLVVLNLKIGKKTTKDLVNETLKKSALNGDLVEQIKYSLNNELVSSDIVGTTACAIFDSNATIVTADGMSVVLYIWYDNEYGYSHQVMRLSKYISKVRRNTYY